MRRMRLVFSQYFLLVVTVVTVETHFCFNLFQVLHFSVAFQMCTGKDEIILGNEFEK